MHQVTVDKATVEIRVLRVGRRQVTKIIFWQIPEMDPFVMTDHPELREDATIWGYVRMARRRDDVEYYGKHYWVLWSMRDEVYRCLVPFHSTDWNSRHGRFDSTTKEEKRKMRFIGPWGYWEDEIGSEIVDEFHRSLWQVVREAGQLYIGA